MQLPKFALALTASILLFGCISQFPPTKSSPTPSANTPTPDNITIKAAIEELKILHKKVKDGVNVKGYSDLIADTVPVIQKARGDAKAVAAVKSAFEGHELALKFWQCNYVNGYEELRQCRSKALSGIFAKYPDLEAEAKVAVKSQDLLTISTGLDEDELLKRIWEKTSADTETAHQAISPDPSQTASQR